MPTEDTTDDRTDAVLFTLCTEAEAGVLPRVLELFAKRGLVPQTLRSALRPAAGALDISLEVAGLTAAETGHVANCLRALPLVVTVRTAERRPG